MTSGKMVTHFPSSARWIDNARGAALVQELQNPAGKGTEGRDAEVEGKGQKSYLIWSGSCSCCHG